MAAENGIEVEASRTVKAAPERVFRAWLDPATAAHFLFSSDDGEIIRCDIDPVSGGEFLIVDRRDDEDVEHMGEFVEVVPPHRIVFDFSVNQSQASRVTVDIRPADGGSYVRISHRLAAQWAPHAERARQGWMNILEKLARAVG